MNRYNIDPDIRKAKTLPASFYRDTEVFDLIKEKVFSQSWHWVGDEQLVAKRNSAHPFILLENYLSEPMMLIRDDDQIRCLSNVCTHRGNIIINEASEAKHLTCRYHGRRFGMDGQFKSMPQFKEVIDFPTPCDNLHEFPLEKWGPFLFVGLNPSFSFARVIKKMKERLDFLLLSDFKFDADTSKDYHINCHWALYCDNYLEGFHIPWVHPDLNATLDLINYGNEIYEHCNLQIGYAEEGEEVFDLPEDHIDYGKGVAAYYYWVFPNMMFNFYPWGLSVNIVHPIDKDNTTVSFLSYVYDETKRNKGAGSILDQVEMEDEFVVEGVHKGLQSRIYNSGRFSPTMEKGVHHFHRLLAEFLG